MPRVFLGALESQEEFNHDFPANSPGSLCGAAPDKLCRNFELLGVVLGQIPHQYVCIQRDHDALSTAP